MHLAIMKFNKIVSCIRKGSNVLILLCASVMPKRPALEAELGWNAQCTGSQLIPMKILDWGKWNYNFVTDLHNSDQLTTNKNFCLLYIRGGAWVVLGWILDIKGGIERNFMLPYSEVQWSFWELGVFSEVWAPSSSTFTNYMLCL